MCMACYLHSESESQPAIPACNCHYAGQSCSFPILSSLPPDHDRLTRLLNCAALMLICVIQLYNVEVAMLFRYPLLRKLNLDLSKYILMQYHAANFMIEVVLIYRNKVEPGKNW